MELPPEVWKGRTGTEIMKRTWALLLCLAAVTLAWVFSLRSSSFSEVNASSPAGRSSWTTPAPGVEGKKIYFVPIGNFPAEQLHSLAEFYRQKYKLEITVLDSIPVDPATKDSSRQQLVAENLVASVRSGVREHRDEPKAILIGFTSHDIYPASMNWRFAFGWREADASAAVVSTARLSLAAGGQLPDADVSTIRLRKIVTKDIGLLYYGFPQSDNPKSVLYNRILGIEELDQAGEDF